MERDECGDVVCCVARCKKGRRKIIPRDTFTKCGESTNYSKTYPGVPGRTLNEIPRLTADNKRGICGPSAVGDFIKKRVQKEIDEKGHPLFWGEWKPVSIFISWVSDFEATEIVDLTPGSGAFAIAAIYSNKPYTGVCFNAAHRSWVEKFLDTIFVGIVASEKTIADDEVVESVKLYLKHSVEQATMLLPKEPTALVECFAGADDSDLDE